MKRKVKLLCLCFVLLIGVSSCTDNLNAPDSASRGSSLGGSLSSQSLSSSITPSIVQSFASSSYEVTDASGTIHVKYFWNSTGAAQHNTLSVVVDPNYVVIGGSAIAFYGSGAGALLTESRPDFVNNAWIGSSTDHVQGDAHYLWVTAIGLRIDGVSASQLKSYISVTSATSSVSSGPFQSVTLPSGYVLLGGGATVNQPGSGGNLLISSYPSSQNTWYASGHDQIQSGPASITTYVIGIQSSIPNFGNISSWQSPYGPVSGGSGAYTIYNNGFIGGWVPTCPGAVSTNSGSWGRMLSGIHVGPGVSLSTSGNGSASFLFNDTQWGVDEFFMSKDHLHADGGTLTGYVVRIQKQ